MADAQLRHSSAVWCFMKRCNAHMHMHVVHANLVQPHVALASYSKRLLLQRLSLMSADQHLHGLMLYRLMKGVARNMLCHTLSELGKAAKCRLAGCDRNRH